MHRIDGAGATNDNRFTDGNPASATPATVVTDDWLNAVQEEIAAVITDSSIDPPIVLDKTKNNQLAAAIKKIAAKFAAATQATETVLGAAKIATQSLLSAGADDSTIVTPKKLRAGFSALLATTGYLALPSWLGGLIFQWGTASANTAGTGGVVATFSLQFPTECMFATCSGATNSTTSAVEFVQVISASTTSITGVTYNNVGGPGLGALTFQYFALGR